MTAFEGPGRIRRTLEKRDGFQLESFGRATTDTEGRASEATLKALDEIIAAPERFSLAHLQKAATLNLATTAISASSASPRP